MHHGCSELKRQQRNFRSFCCKLQQCTYKTRNKPKKKEKKVYNFYFFRARNYCNLFIYSDGLVRAVMVIMKYHRFSVRVRNDRRKRVTVSAGNWFRVDLHWSCGPDRSRTTSTAASRALLRKRKKKRTNANPTARIFPRLDFARTAIPRRRRVLLRIFYQFGKE